MQRTFICDMPGPRHMTDAILAIGTNLVWLLLDIKVQL